MVLIGSKNLSLFVEPLQQKERSVEKYKVFLPFLKPPIFFLQRLEKVCKRKAILASAFFSVQDNMF